MVRSLINSKSHVFIKTDRKGILLINSQSMDGMVFDSISNKLLSQALSPCFGSDKQHFQSLFLHSHEGNRSFAFAFCNNQAVNYLERLRNKFFYFLYFTAR